MAIPPYKGVKQRISCDIECHKEHEFTRQLSMYTQAHSSDQWQGFNVPVVMLHGESSKRLAPSRNVPVVMS